MLNSTEQTFLQPLVDPDEAVMGMPAASSKLNLLPLFVHLDDLARQLPRDTDEELHHFLKRDSYEKARARLEGLAVERGSCGY
jgi:tRNA isopentenyl-2-thiomethyl-A-37 hydroxylase MiaE